MFPTSIMRSVEIKGLAMFLLGAAVMLGFVNNGYGNVLESPTTDQDGDWDAASTIWSSLGQNTLNQNYPKDFWHPSVGNLENQVTLETGADVNLNGPAPITIARLTVESGADLHDPPKASVPDRVDHLLRRGEEGELR